MSKPTHPALEALQSIVTERDECAEGRAPSYGPDQAFDDWAADLASAAIPALEALLAERDSLRGALAELEDSGALDCVVCSGCPLCRARAALAKGES